MTTYNTGNPVGSATVKDLYDNAENLDVAINSQTAGEWTDRLGNARQTWKGIEDKAEIDIAASASAAAASASAAAAGYRDETLAARNDAQAAASAIGPVKFFDTKAQADAAIGTLANGDIIEISQDETRAGARTRYKVQAGALVFVVNLDQVRIDLSPRLQRAILSYPDYAAASAAAATLPDGQSVDVESTKIRYTVAAGILSNGRSTDQVRIDLTQPEGNEPTGGFKTYADLRAYTGNATSSEVGILGQGIYGKIYRDDSDTTTPDDGGISWRDGLERCWKRCDVSELRAEYYGVVKGVATDSAVVFGNALRASIRLKRELVLPDYLFKVGTVTALQASVDAFTNIRIKGTFATTATALQTNPEICGTVIYTDGNSVVDAWFDNWSAENIKIKGVGFYDKSAFPATNPKSTVAPIVVQKGNLTGEGVRYITGNIFEDCAAVGYVAIVDFVGRTPTSVPFAALLNYVGPTSFIRADVKHCTNAIRLLNATANHLWASESTWFEIDGSCVTTLQLGGGSGGNVCATLDKMVIEGTAGIFNTAGALIGVDAIRNKLVLNSVNHEFCGRFGPTEPNGFYSGSPLGYVANTDVFINGVWTEGTAYGETSLPNADTGSAIYSTTPAKINVNGGGKVKTSNLINRETLSFILPASGSVSFKVTLLDVSAGFYDATTSIVVSNGDAGKKVVQLFGSIAGPRYSETSGTYAAGFSLAVATTGVATAGTVTITNGTTYTVLVDVDLRSNSGGRFSLAVA